MYDSLCLNICSIGQPLNHKGHPPNKRSSIPSPTTISISSASIQAPDYSMEGDYHLPQDQYHPSQDKYHPPQDQYHVPPDQYPLPPDQYHMPQNEYLPPQDEHLPPPQDEQYNEDSGPMHCTCIGTLGPQIVGVTIPHEREVGHREFSCGVIYNTSSRLTFTSDAIIGTCTRTTTTSTHAPNRNRNHPHTSASASSNSVFIVELNKSTIKAIKVATKDELCPEMMQGRDVVPLSSRKRGTLIDNTVMKARISVIGPAPGEEMAHKAAVVPTLLKNLNYLHKLELYWLLEAQYFVDMIIDVVWQKGLYKYINPLQLDSAITLAGAAVHNALKAYCMGTVTVNIRPYHFLSFP
ncbi:hypothetical protein F4604DRAFT_1695006 [Suillus subluteus]|nr:hypothetical protein F4604DRAFT_1695006 [Suillus subluteus]